MKNPNLFLLGNSSKGLGKDYSLPSDTQSRIFGIFNAIAIIATTYGNGIIPEIQVSTILIHSGKEYLNIGSACLLHTCVDTHKSKIMLKSLL